jgi:hypothetical protein
MYLYLSTYFGQSTPRLGIDTVNFINPGLFPTALCKNAAWTLQHRYIGINIFEPYLGKQGSIWP